jgi:Domain of unknown function (DUF5919)
VTPDEEAPRNVIDLRGRSAFKPDLAALARNEIAGARGRLGLSYDEFAKVLTPLLGWSPTPTVIEAWETSSTPPGDAILAAGVASQAGPLDMASDLIGQILGRRFSDVQAVYATRTEFLADVPPHNLFDEATDVRAAGLSLNLLCQSVPDDQLRAIAERGGRLECLFLAPFGKAIGAREVEEGYPAGHLSSLTEMNVQILDQRVRARLPAELRDRVHVATYDEPIRFNLTVIDRDIAIVQPYLHGARGLESPTFLIHRQPSAAGLFDTFDQTYTWLSERSTPV